MLSLLNLLAFLAVAGYAIYLFVNLVYTRYLFIKLGKKAEFEPNLKERFNLILVNGFGQSKLFKDKKSGLMHVILFYTFFIIQVGLIELIIKGFIKGYEFPFGEAHKYFSLLQEWATFLMLLAVVYGFYRRYGEKIKRLQWKRDGKAAFVYIALSILTLSILVTLGFETVMLNHEPNLVYAPFSGAVALLFSGIGTTAGTVMFYGFWWVHMLTVFTFMVFVPQSKQFHELFAMVNIFFKKSGPVGKLKKIDFEDETAEEFGVGKIEDFTQHQLIDLYACAECGRCTNMCPASGTGKTLSPMELIIKMRNHLTEKGAAVTSRQPWMPAFAFKNTRGNQLALVSSAFQEVSATIESESLIGDVVTEEEIWACTTCRNCEDQCPVMNEHVDKIIDLRRYLVLTEGKMNPDAQRAMTNIERQGNPWGINRKERINWRNDVEDVTIPTAKELKKTGEEFDYLFFVGSMGSYDNRSQKLTQSFTRLLNKAGVKVAILGNEEKNSGDTPRRLGNEFLFQELVNANIETFKKYHVKKIVTMDPHAFNTLKNEYPEFGLEAEVYHHTELLETLIKEGKIIPNKKVEEVITYHDSCYLGRYNNVYDAPREILKAIPGVKIVEPERKRENVMCCGAGGGLMWMEEDKGTRINVSRTEQLLETNPTIISTGCPYCLTMISDGTKAKEVEEKVQTLDVVEILEKSVI
ncbi:(Fe-S)-binding protein [Metabacillus sediminilitoris]|uniref:(Fe-S)-binding protein n=1 Tax=Metabacillus sediminilitoris TaxID=2567941 RepID=A0A4V3WEC1_9BACI|nr:(Fe-S)-binding protein [Metabacillus sediminilitoris]QGQ45624.1 4Fe-4S dicluster domain-containing protein [Metabacillus sediminilitoris]THF75665.1 (Fe-S)-binding protein [Metabacillus sediminilitoris]